MRKTFQISWIAAVILALLSASVISGLAYTYFYTDEGLKYRNVSKDTVAISGVSGAHENIVIPAEITEKTVVMIDDYAFRDNTTLKSIDMSAVSSGFSLGEGAFLNCKALEHVTVPPTVRYLYADLFRNCSSLESAELQAAVSEITENMFSGCAALKEFSVPDSVTTINRYAFAYCTDLQKVVIPQSVTEIAISAFYQSPNLTIYCYEGSYAQQYAEERDIPYVLIQTYETGDVDRDGALSITDVTLIQKYLAELATLDADQLLLADYLSDGEVDIADATAIQIAIAD